MVKISSTSAHHPLHSKRRTPRLPLGAQRLLAALEGIEGGFAVGASMVVALALAGLDTPLLVLTVVVSVIVSGFNTASVKYSSEHYLDELDGHEKKSALKHYFMPALIEFACYCVLGLLVVTPLLVVHSLPLAVVISVVATIVLLFAAGLWRGYVLHMSGVRDGLETAILGTGIIAIGLLGGLVVHSL